MQWQSLQEPRRSGRLRNSRRAPLPVTTSHLPREIRLLLETDLDSFEKLEVLMRVRGTGLATDDATLDNEAMRSSLSELLHAGLIEKRGTAYVLGPRGHEPTVEEIMTLYGADRMSIIAELSSLAMERIRTMASKAFANAFVLRKKKKDDNG